MRTQNLKIVRNWLHL